MSRKKIYHCKVCGKECRPRSHDRKSVYCSRECVLAYIEANRKRLDVTCAGCGKLITIEGSQYQNHVVRGQKPYCSPDCSKRFQFKGLVAGAARCRLDPHWRKRQSDRMKQRNPMSVPGAKEKMIQAMKGRPFVSRGGNGQLAKQQSRLHDATGLPMEYAIPTRDVKHLFEAIPHCYKVDLSEPVVKLAVEVDGKSHKLAKWRSFDALKTEVLNALGWTVLRFTNEEVDESLEKCVQMITSTILRLKSTITTSPTESSSTTVIL